MIRSTFSALVLGLAATLALPGTAAKAQVEPFVGQMMQTGIGFCPRNWSEANGALLSISQNQALFSLLGTTYGGDGRTTFGLPDLRGRTVVGAGAGQDLPPVTRGERSGTVSFTINQLNLPSHSHRLVASEDDAASADPAGAVPAVRGTPGYVAGLASLTQMNASAITATGGSLPIDKRSPFLGSRWCIALFGTYPSRQ